MTSPVMHRYSDGVTFRAAVVMCLESSDKETVTVLTFGSVIGANRLKVRLLCLKVPSVQSSHVVVLHLCLSHRVTQCFMAGAEVPVRGQALLLLLLLFSSFS
jgi:hypothetical protein